MKQIERKLKEIQRIEREKIEKQREREKKKILSSEEIEIEKIKREKEEIKKQKILHEKCYLRSKNYICKYI